MASLTAINAALNLGIGIANLIIPGVGAVITDIKALPGTAGTVTYEVTLQVGAADLSKIKGVDQADLDAINAELARQGQTPV